MIEGPFEFVSVNGKSLPPKEVERVTPPERGLYWRIKMVDDLICLATGNVTVIKKGGL